MDSSDLTPDQCRQIKDRIGPTLTYLGKLERRMEKRGFPDDDALFLKVAEAHRAMGEVFMSLHYRSCKPGTVWRND